MSVLIDELVPALKAEGIAEVDSSKRRRAEYSTDASNYRVVPQVVVFPRSSDEVLAALEVSRRTGTPITSRGAGTSVAGNAVGTGIVLDFSRHLNKILDLDPEARTARVQPGVIMSSLQKAAAPHGLRFGPDPSTQNRATLGGMIGNNACGPHAVAYGRTADNVSEILGVTGTGDLLTAGAGDLSGVAGLQELVTGNMALIRQELGRFTRQVSGYSLEHLLPEKGRNLARALVGTEGTCLTILEATVDLVPQSAAPVLVVLGYPDMPSAADAVPPLLKHKPLAVEGLDARLVDVVRRVKGAAAVPDLPAGAGWLMCEVGGDTLEEALARAEELVKDAGTKAYGVFPPGPQATAMWQIRADGAGLGGRTPANEPAWPGFEDSAVPPEKLGTYLRELEALMKSHGVDGLAFGHFGDGCVHLRLDIPMADSPKPLRDFMTDAANLVASHGGSLSGEHGDGRARSELLSVMYSPQALQLFGQFKQLFAPNNLLNPGVLVDPDPLDANLRRPAAAKVPASTGFSFAHDGGDFTTAVHRCVGVGKCRADNSAAGGFMCPSYLATKDEKDVTRGRARVLQELTNGNLLARDWSSKEVHEALDLCLSCKACSSDCPAGVDMAQYKSEVLHRTYEGKLRPVNHYILGWLPRWGRLVSSWAPLAKLANAVLSVRPLAKAVFWAGGMDTRRKMADFASKPFRKWARSSDQVTVGQPSAHQPKPVLLWVDSFSDAMDPEVPIAAVQVLQAAGYQVLVPDQEVCCGLTWISTGQLTGAKKRLRQLLDVLAPYAVNDIPIVGLEPSCTGVLRSDLLDLLPEDPRSSAVSKAVHTLAELLTAPLPVGPDPASGWKLPDLSDVTAVAQPHCHQYSVMGYGPDQKLLESAGAKITTLAGCCGLAGNFGMEKGHYETSVAVANNALLPALEKMGEADIYLADGYSCRTQADNLAGVSGLALAELLAERLPKP